MGALSREDDSMARLQAMLGSDDWAPEGSTGAQAALAQASAAITPALRTDSASSGRPPLPDSRPHNARAQTARQPENAIDSIRATHAAQQPLAAPCAATAIPQRPEPVPQARSSLPEAVTLEVRPSVGKQAQKEPVCQAQSPLPDVWTQEVTSSTEHASQIPNGKGSSGGAAAAPAAAPVSVAPQPLTEEGRAEFVRTLTAKIAEATQQAALGAISSSVEVCTSSL